jgi:hypothetical protein
MLFEHGGQLIRECLRTRPCRALTPLTFRLLCQADLFLRVSDRSQRSLVLMLC